MARLGRAICGAIAAMGSNRLSKGGDVQRSIALLRQNLEAFEGRSDLAESSDRRFVALSRAGLAVIDGGAETARPWQDFLSLSWSAEWLEYAPAREPAAVWAECE